jgi:predicted metal-dependent peptidase
MQNEGLPDGSTPAAGRRVLENAVVRLLKERPFYGHFLLHFRREVASGPHALGVVIRHAVPTLCVNPAVFSRFPPGEQQALLEHVLKHVLHLHPARRKERHSLTWDIACDLAINPTIAGLPPQAAYPERFQLEPGLAAEEYWRLLRPRFDSGNLEGEGLGTAAPQPGGRQEAAAGAEAEGRADRVPAATVDDHSPWAEADSTPEVLAGEVVRGMVREAWRASGGEVPGEVRLLVESWLAPPPIPWREVLRQFVATAGRVGRKSTWKREHRRFGHATPGSRKRQRLNLLVGIDVSDSTGRRELREAFARELVRLARGRESLLTVLYAGSRIQKIDAFRSHDVVTEVYAGGGFTDLRPVFDYARTLQPRPAAVIYLTDGFGEAPPTMEYPTLWVLTRDGQKPAPWGLELRLDEG